MVEELRKFILEEYAFKQKAIDEQFYRGIAEIIKNKKSLSNVYRKMEFIRGGKESETAAPGEYNALSRIITVNIPRIEKEVLQITQNRSFRITNMERPLIKYLYSAHVVIHEMIHACQKKYLSDFFYSDKKNIAIFLDTDFDQNQIYMFGTLGKLESIRRINKWKDFLKKYYHYDVLNERDAEIKSYSIAYSMLKPYEKLYPNILQYEKAELYESISMGYKNSKGKVISPAYQYAHILLSNNMIPRKNAEWYDRNMEKSLENVRKLISGTSDRLKLGLPVSAEEFKAFSMERERFDMMGYIIHSYGRDGEENTDPQAPTDR